MNGLKKAKQIVDNFYDEYLRVPNGEEFKDLGGDMTLIRRKYSRYHSTKKNSGYGNFLKDIGYERPTKSQTYEVYNRKGDVIFTGTPKDIAEEFDIKNTSTIIRDTENHGLLKNEYYIRLKPYVFKNKELEK